MALTSDEILSGLPDTFRYSEALDHISERQLRCLIGDGSIIAFARGLYRKSNWLGDEDLIEIAARASQATLCLRSALARHELIDDIPAEVDIAIPRGSWAPETTAPVRSMISAPLRETTAQSPSYRYVIASVKGASAMASDPTYNSPWPCPRASGLPSRAAVIRSSSPATVSYTHLQLPTTSSV